MGNTCGGGGKQGKGVKSIESFPVVYVGTMSLPATAYAGVDACYHVVTTLNQERSRQTQGNGDENGHGGDDDDDDDEMGPEAGHNQATSTDPEEEDFSAHLDEGLKDVKAVLTVSIYGIKALRTSFAGMKQKDVQEYGSGGVAFDLVLNEAIFRIAFCTDVNKTFCFITQDRESGILQCHVFDCKTVRMCKQIVEATAAACAKVYSTINILKEHLRSPQEVLSADGEGDGGEDGGGGGARRPLIDLIMYEGYVDADEQFQQEMLELAGIDTIPYQEPAPEGPAPPTMRTLVRQADPNEYERTRL